MSKQARTIFYYGLCVMMPLGAWCLLFPDSFLQAFALPPSKEPWIRVVGWVISGIGFYYVYSALHEQLAFAWITAPGRSAAAGFFAIMAFAYKLPTLTIFGLLDVAGAAWTFWAFRLAGASALTRDEHVSKMTRR
jgi:hypothetical protein